MREEYFVTEETAGDRIDKFLAEQYENLSRSFLQKLLKSGEVMVDGRPVKASYKVAEGDRGAGGCGAGDRAGGYSTGYFI